MQPSQPPVSAQPGLLGLIEAIQRFAGAGKTGRITAQIKEGRIMQVETTEVKRV